MSDLIGSVGRNFASDKKRAVAHWAAMSIALISILVLQGSAAPVEVGQAPPTTPGPAAGPAVSGPAEPPGSVAAPAATPAAPATPVTPVTPVTPATPQPIERVDEQPASRTPGTFSDAQIRWINRRWSGVGVGYDNGIWGGIYGQSVKVSIPFGRNLGRYLGMRIRGMVVHHVDSAADQYDPVINVGGELFGRSPVWWGVLRVYGGGGLWAGIRPKPTSSGAQYRLAGGGFVGFEAFAAPFMAFTFEVGGQAPGHGGGVDAGGSVMGGMMFYFGRNETRFDRR
jgi:hypothetical protein